MGAERTIPLCLAPTFVEPDLVEKLNMAIPSYGYYMSYSMALYMDKSNLI
jgi:hypothetical protein